MKEITKTTTTYEIADGAKFTDIDVAGKHEYEIRHNEIYKKLEEEFSRIYDSETEKYIWLDAFYRFLHKEHYAIDTFFSRKERSV